MLLSILFFTSAAFAAPSLSNQAAWSDSDKKEFIDYLETGRGAPVEGQVKDVAPADPNPFPRGSGRKPFYVSFESISHLMVSQTPTGSAGDEALTIGPRLLVGGHLFSWVRYFSGLEYTSLRSRVGHYQIPLGLELALIPLGAPHTQYFLLRGAIGLNWFNRDAGEPFAASLSGMQTSWDLGLGYEWQIAESRFRVHALAETQFGFASGSYYSAGLTAGLAYLF